MIETHERVEDAVAAFARGEIVVVTDDDDRENEGDLFVAASLCTPEKMAFIIRNTSGIVCAPLSADEARRLHLDPMVAANDAPLGTAFTVSVDVRHGLTTGISAEERTNTVRALANGNSGATDFVRPGHVFPLVAKEGGVLMRSGHTEACIDLCRLAGLPPVGVLSELMNDDGTVMRGPAVIAFAERHRLKQISIADLIAYRQARDKLVKRVGEFPVKSEIGTLTGYAYVTPFDAVHHMAVVHGKIGDGKRRAGAAAPRRHHSRRVRRRQSGARRAAAHSSRRAEACSCSCATVRPACRRMPSHRADHGSEAARTRQWREVGLGAQILKDLGISSIRLLTSAKMTYVGLAGFGIEITDTETVGWLGRLSADEPEATFSAAPGPMSPSSRMARCGEAACAPVSRSGWHRRRRCGRTRRAWFCRPDRLREYGHSAARQARRRSTSNSCSRSTSPTRWIRRSRRCSARATWRRSPRANSCRRCAGHAWQDRHDLFRMGRHRTISRSSCRGG